MPFDQNAYNNDFKKANYDRVTILVPKGYKGEIQSYAQANDLSMNQLILKAIESQYHFDFSKPPKGKK